MKIALISDAWHPQINGVVTTLINTAKHLKEQGYEIELITPEQFWNWPCPTYPTIRLAIGCGKKLAGILQDFQPGQIHIATEGPLGLAARAFCLKKKLPFTTSFHTLFPEYVNLRFKIPVDWGYAYLRWFHAPAYRVMVATKAVEQNLEKRGFRNLVHWSRGVDTSIYRPREKTFLSAPRPIFMYVGRVAIEKSIEDFLKQDLPGSKFVVGDGPQLDKLKHKYPDVHFVGFKTGETLAKYVANADVFVFPSRTDTFGIVMLDALSSGVPVAAYPVQGPCDVLLDSRIGCMDDDIRKAALDALPLNAQECRNYAMKYSWENCTCQFISHLAPAVCWA